MFRAGTLVVKASAAVRSFTLKGWSLISCNPNVVLGTFCCDQNLDLSTRSEVQNFYYFFGARLVSLMTFVGFLQYVSLIVHIPTCALKYCFFCVGLHACINIGRDDHLILRLRGWVRLQFLEIIWPQRSGNDSTGKDFASRHLWFFCILRISKKEKQALLWKLNRLWLYITC
jgi:hypothetical protein